MANPLSIGWFPCLMHYYFPLFFSFLAWKAMSGNDPIEDFSLNGDKFWEKCQNPKQKTSRKTALISRNLVKMKPVFKRGISSHESWPKPSSYGRFKQHHEKWWNHQTGLSIKWTLGLLVITEWLKPLGYGRFKQVFGGSHLFFRLPLGPVLTRVMVLGI
jgi:hypothetical protein